MTGDGLTRLQKRAALAASIFGIASLLFGICGFDQPLNNDKSHMYIFIIKRIQVVVLVLWLVLPPIWFWFEQRWKSRLEPPSTEFDRFKYSQEQAAKIWLALVTALFGIYFGKDLHL
jgi:hypothetical protein